MSSKETIQHSLNFSEMVMGKYLDDLKPEAFVVRPVAGMNHLAWQIGHLIAVENRFMEVVRPGSSPALPEGFAERYALDRRISDDPAAFLPKDEIVALWRAQRAATRAVLETLDEADLHAPLPDEKMRAMCPTVATVFNLAGLHTLLHAGQFVAVRRHEAMPVVW